MCFCPASFWTSALRNAGYAFFSGYIGVEPQREVGLGGYTSLSSWLVIRIHIVMGVLCGISPANSLWGLDMMHDRFFDAELASCAAGWQHTRSLTRYTPPGRHGEGRSPG